MHTLSFGLVFLLSVVKANSQPKISFDNGPNERRHMTQTCSIVPHNKCCIPIDVFVSGSGLGWGWFRPQHIVFDDLPTYNVHVTAWKRRPPLKSCDGELVIDHLTIGEASADYTNNSPEGFSGGYYFRQELVGGNSADAKNNTLQSQPDGLLIPDSLHYQGETYQHSGTRDFVYVSRTGKIITGALFSDMPIDPSAQNTAPTLDLTAT